MPPALNPTNSSYILTTSKISNFMRLVREKNDNIGKRDPNSRNAIDYLIALQDLHSCLSLLNPSPQPSLQPEPMILLLFQ